jgi:hypothetical protein
LVNELTFLLTLHLGSAITDSSIDRWNKPITTENNMRTATATSVCKALGKKFDVKVRVRGERAYTDGKLINIPDMGTELSEDQAMILRGYVDHEAGGHIQYTDFSVKAANTRIHKMFNLFEDFRVEKLLGNKYPGCKANLTALTNHLIGSDKGEITPWQALYVEGFRKVAGEEIEHKNVSDIAKKFYGDDIIDRLNEMSNSQDAHDLAVAVLEETKEKIEEKKAAEESESESSLESEENC